MPHTQSYRPDSGSEWCIPPSGSASITSCSNPDISKVPNVRPAASKADICGSRRRVDLAQTSDVARWLLIHFSSPGLEDLVVTALAGRVILDGWHRSERAPAIRGTACRESLCARHFNRPSPSFTILHRPSPSLTAPSLPFSSSNFASTSRGRARLSAIPAISSASRQAISSSASSPARA